MTVEQEARPAPSRLADEPQSVRGPLQPIELATAAVLGAMTVVLVIAGWFLPHASAITALGAVPMGVVGYRHRPRAVVAAVVASTSVGFLVAGTGVISTIVLCGIIGGLAGHAHRRHWSLVRLVAVAAVIGPMVAAVIVGLLLVFSSLRKLTLEQLRNTWRGLSGVVGRLVGAIPGHHSLGLRITRDLDQGVGWAIRNWWETVAIVLIGFTVLASVLSWRLLGVVFERLERIRATDRLAAATATTATATATTATTATAAAGPLVPGRAIEPVPVLLSDVSVRYPGADGEALAGVGLNIALGEMVAILGPNGSGKSTLARVLAGCPPTDGEVIRRGDVGLGEPGGTAIIAQRPESQVLGVRVADDLVWGLPRDFEVDTPALLDAVGLSGLEKRETSGLSGGQLQRLAVAAALARRPQLLISDESTAMIDADGRRQLVALLSDLPHRRDMTVVHVTHRVAETTGADRVVRLDAGHLVSEHLVSEHLVSEPLVPEQFDVAEVAAAPPESDRELGWGPPVGARPAIVDEPPVDTIPIAPSGAAAAWGLPASAPGSSRDTPREGPAGDLRLRLRHVGHVYADGTPWSQAALCDVDLGIRAGEGVLIVGGNGSGKSTLAWILAGLLRPTFGDCEIDGRAAHEQVGGVAIAFQHARLQVQRSTVGRDVEAAGGVDRSTAEKALRSVGLDPVTLWDRAVDELSGGQLRRVALAGLLTRVPRVLVLDEPLAGLDDASRTALLAVLADLRTTHGLTLVVISHDLEGAGHICDRVVRLEDGRVVSDEALVDAGAGAR